MRYDLVLSKQRSNDYQMVTGRFLFRKEAKAQRLGICRGKF